MVSWQCLLPACAAQIASLACSHDGITILFLDIVGFTQCSKVRALAACVTCMGPFWGGCFARGIIFSHLQARTERRAAAVPAPVDSQDVSAEEVIVFLNYLFCAFDKLVEKYQVQKVGPRPACPALRGGYERQAHVCKQCPQQGIRALFCSCSVTLGMALPGPAFSLKGPRESLTVGCTPFSAHHPLSAGSIQQSRFSEVCTLDTQVDTGGDSMIVATGILAPDEEGFRAVDRAHDHAAGAGVLLHYQGRCVLGLMVWCQCPWRGTWWLTLQDALTAFGSIDKRFHFSSRSQGGRATVPMNRLPTQHASSPTRPAVNV